MYHFLLFPGRGQRDGSEVEQLKLEPVPLWDAGVAGCGFTHCATTPALPYCFLKAAALVYIPTSKAQASQILRVLPVSSSF